MILKQDKIRGRWVEYLKVKKHKVKKTEPDAKRFIQFCNPKVRANI